MAKNQQGEYDNWLVAIRDPTRRRILWRMHDSEMISPVELSREFGKRLDDVAYHVRVLARCKAITLVKKEPVRGVVQHFYRRSNMPPWALQLLVLDPDLRSIRR